LISFRRSGRTAMIRPILLSAAFVLTRAPAAGGPSAKPSFHVLAFYTDKGEPDHIMFAQQALRFLSEAAKRGNFSLESTTDWDESNPRTLKRFELILWLNDFPKAAGQRTAFEEYMEGGGGWLGFHVSAYNDEDTRWPWFVGFLGGAVFYGNNWPPLPAQLTVDDQTHPVTRQLARTLSAPANEWYIWRPSPRLNKNVKVLLSLDPANYPLGLKDTITAGDLPVVWTNTRYRMLYMNMGHGDQIFTSKEQNRLFEDAILWLGRQ
jgi:type 1 glutamine amidotransferase